MPDPTETTRRKRVFFPPGDALGWALDEDLRLLRASLDRTAIPSSLARAEIVHTVFWPHLLHLPRALLARRRVLSYADNPPFHYLTSADFILARERVDLWIGRSREAVSQFGALGLPAQFAPYTVDAGTFRPVAPDDPRLAEMRARWSIPERSYVIANFHRDTEGYDLRSPKLQKGPDLFAEIVERLVCEGRDIHVLLAGPRRFYLRRRLAESGVPFTFAGEGGLDRDDMRVNILPRTELSLLYQIADLCLVSSRWEGGPHSILEAAATRTKVASTRVGIALDVLEPSCLYDHAGEAAAIIGRDIESGALEATREIHFRRAMEHHTAVALRGRLEAIYGGVNSAPPGIPASLRDFARGLMHREKMRSARSVSILGDHCASLDPAVDALRRRGVAVTESGEAVVALVPEAAPPPGAVRAMRSVPACLLADQPACVIPRIPPRDHSPHSPLRVRRAGFQPGEPVGSFDILVLGPGAIRDDALISQAIACRAPILYPAAPGLRETVWLGGLSYERESDIPARLEILQRDFESFRRLIAPPPAWELADRLRQAADAAINMRLP